MQFCDKIQSSIHQYSPKCIQQFPYDPHSWRVPQDFYQAPPHPPSKKKVLLHILLLELLLSIPSPISNFFLRGLFFLRF